MQAESAAIGRFACALLAGCSAVPAPDSDGALEKFSASVNTLKTEISGTFDY